MTVGSIVSASSELVSVKLVDGIDVGEFRIAGMDDEMQAYLENGSYSANVFKDADGNTRVLGENLLLVNKGDYWAVATVPEPAEWACILGAMAIAFVAYRRRRA